LSVVADGVPHWADLPHPATVAEGGRAFEFRCVGDGECTVFAVRARGQSTAGKSDDGAALLAAASLKGEVHRVGPNCETWPNTLTENPYKRALELAHNLGHPCAVFVTDMLHAAARGAAARVAKVGQPMICCSRWLSVLFASEAGTTPEASGISERVC
jgi:hypothetical protein